MEEEITNDYELFMDEISDIEQHSENLDHFLKMMSEYLKHNTSKKVATLLTCFYFRRIKIIRLSEILDFKKN